MKNSTPTGIAAMAVGLCVSLGSAAALAQPGATPDRGGAAAASADPSWRSAAARFGGVETDTEPSRDVTMRFSFPTEIREVHVVGGQRVKKGDLLIRARDGDVKAMVEQQKLRSETDLEVKASEAALEIAKFRFSNLSKARAEGSGTELEFEERRIELKQAELQLEQAKVRLTEQEILLRQVEGRYEQLRLEAPFDGTVEEVMVDVGQGVNEQMPAIRVVNTELLWLDAYPKTSETLELGLKEGSKAWVLVDLPGGARMAEGAVLYVSPVADSVSQRRRVRVEIANVGGWPAGTQAMVRFSAPEGEWPRAEGAEGGVASTAGAEASR